MPLKLKPATKRDALRAAEIEAAAYAPNPFNHILFPGPFPPDALQKRADDLAQELQTDNTARWLKVVDTDAAEDNEPPMIAFAKWHIYTQRPRPTPRTFGPGCNAEACEMLFGGIAEQRARILGDRPYVYLSLLHTDPSHQGRGAGGMLVAWGVAEAARRALPAYLEASEAGHSLYQRCGFADVEVMALDLGRWGAVDEHRTWSMMTKSRGDAVK